MKTFISLIFAIVLTVAGAGAFASRVSRRLVNDFPSVGSMPSGFARKMGLPMANAMPRSNRLPWLEVFHQTCTSDAPRMAAQLSRQIVSPIGSAWCVSLAGQ